VWCVSVCLCGKVQSCAHTISVHMEYNIYVHMEDDIYIYVHLDYNIYTRVHMEYNVCALNYIAYVHIVSVMCSWSAVMCIWNGITSANTQIQKCVLSHDLTSASILGSDSVHVYVSAGVPRDACMIQSGGWNILQWIIKWEMSHFTTSAKDL